MSKLEHMLNCPEERIEETEHPGVTRVRCVDCGAQWPTLPPGTVTGALAGAVRGRADQIDVRQAVSGEMPGRGLAAGNRKA